VEYTLLPASGIGGKTKEFRVDRSRDNLEPLVYTDIKQMHDDYKNDVLTPQLLKQAVISGLNALLDPIRKKFESDKVWQECAAKAYPAVEVKKKEKKVKNKGTGYPGAAKVGESVELPLREKGVTPAINDAPPGAQ
jgi:tyrosyl-tRNA synthetase